MTELDRVVQYLRENVHSKSKSTTPVILSVALQTVDHMNFVDVKTFYHSTPDMHRNLRYMWLQRDLSINVVFFSQSDIMDVNQIFKDLAVMIHDQGDMIGEYPSNVYFTLTLSGERSTFWFWNSLQLLSCEGLT